MDYSMLVGVDEERHELVVGIIDFIRQFTWDKQLETWVKASGILGGPKHAAPTIISPDLYKNRFRKAMKTYFVVVPDSWTPQPPPVPRLGTPPVAAAGHPQEGSNGGPIFGKATRSAAHRDEKEKKDGKHSQLAPGTFLTQQRGSQWLSGRS